jgi:hypothetical protein
MLRLTDAEHHLLLGAGGRSEHRHRLSLLGRLATADSTPAIVTWGEHRGLRHAASRLGLTYLSIRHAAPGSRTLNLLRVSAGSTTPPEMVNVSGNKPPSYATFIHEHPHYERFSPLPANCPPVLYHAAKSRVLLTFSAPGGRERVVGQTGLSGDEQELLLRWLRPFVVAEHAIFVMPLEKRARPGAAALAHLIGDREASATSSIRSLPTACARNIASFMQKMDAVVGIHGGVALDALRNGTPIRLLGARTKDWQWLNRGVEWMPDRATLRTIGREQEEQLRHYKDACIRAGFLLPNAHVSAERFHAWLTFARDTQLAVAPVSTVDRSPRLSRHVASTPPIVPLVDPRPLRTWERIRNWQHRPLKKLRKLLRDPRKYLQDSRHAPLRQLYRRWEEYEWRGRS